jgi:hypothetical protein
MRIESISLRIIVLVLLIAVVSAPSAAKLTSGDFELSSRQVVFQGSPLVANSITVDWHQPNVDENDHLYYRAQGDFVGPNGHVISRGDLWASKDGGAYESFLNDVLFLRVGSGPSEIRFKLSDDVLTKPAGVYTGTLVSVNVPVGGRDITVEIILPIRFNVEVISGGNILIKATEGPGVYPADSSAKIEVKAPPNQPWNLTASVSDLGIEGGGGDDPRILGNSVQLALGSNGQPGVFKEGALAMEGSGSRDIEVFFRAKTEWQHRAEIYKGRIVITLAPQ